MLDRLFKRPPQESQEYPLNLGAIEIKLTDKLAYQRIPIANIDTNLGIAQEDGIKPLSLNDVLIQVNPDKIKNMVLFDSPGTLPLPGNHWRVLKLDNVKRIATLQMCGIFGNYDQHQVYPTAVEFDKPLFTGISIQRYTVGGLPAILSEVIAANSQGEKGEVEYDGNTILWSDKRGSLIPRDKHPAFKDKA